MAAFEKEALEKARIRAEQEAKEEAVRKESARIAKAEAEKAEKARIARLLPDKEKLILFADMVFSLALAPLTVESQEARAIFQDAADRLMKLSKEIKKKAEAL